MDEVKLFICESCKTISNEAGICLTCNESLEEETFVPESLWLDEQKDVAALQEQNKKALAQAVTILHLDDSSDYGSALWKIMDILGGKEVTELFENNSREACVKYGECEA